MTGGARGRLSVNICERCGGRVVCETFLVGDEDGARVPVRELLCINCGARPAGLPVPREALELPVLDNHTVWPPLLGRIWRRRGYEFRESR